MQEKHAICHLDDCSEFKKFYRGLTRGVDTISLLELSERNEFFLKKQQNGLTNFSEDNLLSQFNLYCCCRSFLAHRESDKFIIVNQ